MRVKYIAENCYSLTNGKEYEVIGIENGLYRIVDNSNEDYLFYPEEFEVLDIKNAYRIFHISNSPCWIYISADGFYIEDSEPFVLLLEHILKTLNGNVRSVGDDRYIIDIDELELIYQWDDLFGIVVICSDENHLGKAEKFLRAFFE